MSLHNPTKFEENISDDFCIRDQISSQTKIKLKEKVFVNNSLLLLKICLFALAIISLLKVSYISKIRVNRLREIKDAYVYEKVKFINLSNRFDDLFAVNGEQRFMKDQYQIISKGILRVIWR